MIRHLRKKAMSRFSAAFTVLFLLAVSAVASPEADLNISLGALIEEIRSEIRPEQAMEFMRHVYSTDRWFNFPKFQETAEYLKDTMTQMGLQNVEIVAAPADGTSQFGFWTMPPGVGCEVSAPGDH